MTEVLYHAATSNSSYSASTSSSSTCRSMERTSSRLASEYVRTSEELVGYVSFLEGALERARADSLQFQQEAVDAREHASLANHRLNLAHRHAQAISQHKDETFEGAGLCKEQLHLTQALLGEEQLRIKNLESRIEVLEEASKKKDELLNQCKRKERKRRKALEKQNENLLRKATLSWILTCLSNPYLEGDTSKERTASLMRMAQDLLQSSGDHSSKEADSLLSFSDMKARSLRLECAYVQNEIRQLLQISESSLEETPSVSSGSSCKDEYTNWSTEVDKEARGRSIRQHYEGCSPRSILKAVHEELHHLLDAGTSDHAGGSCEAHDQPESEGFLSKESQKRVRARAHHDHDNTRFSVPPLHLPSVRNALSSCVQRAHEDCEDEDGDERQVRLDDNDYANGHFLKKKQDRVSWDLAAPLKALGNKRLAERRAILQCQTDIMKTLRGLKENMGFLLDLEERSRSK